ncbi:MAG: DoxX family protein [Phycisphaerales bacterium]
MTPSQFAATNILPLLARLVLCFAFLPAGWNSLMRDEEYTGADAQRLRELGVRGSTDPDPAKPDISLGALRGEAYWAQAVEPTGGEVKLGSDAAKPAGKDARPAPPPAGPPTPAAAAAPSAGPTLAQSAPQLSPFAPLRQRGLYWYALQADKARIPFPVETAWFVAGVQLVGGACVLLGLFSRIWGLAMAVIVATLFATTALPVLKKTSAFSLTPDHMNLVLAQVGIFVMALQVFLVGPGALSLDRAIFRTRRGRAAGAKSS